MPPASCGLGVAITTTGVVFLVTMEKHSLTFARKMDSGRFMKIAAASCGLQREEEFIDTTCERYVPYGSINAECRELLNVDLNRANYLLRKIYHSGVLVRTGTHRSARYILP